MEGPAPPANDMCSPCKCPLCRRPITLLVPTDDSLSHRHDPEVANALHKIQRYNRLFGEREGGLLQRLQDLPFLLRRLLRDFSDPRRSLPLVIRARVYIAVKYRLLIFSMQFSAPDLNTCLVSLFTQMILSVVYIISPIDIIPEGILGIVGLLDDLLILLICFLHVAALYRSVLYLRHGGS
ncbi:hypothetical protein PIB30_021544 [Stylosanthes scabra]|uniref:DUF1232 domain-containing protein n=1 Tax=Stylosanthes scabra TaxID=79078 RepID=A0ABU6S967_9FABA|nr:hypothetical protein [Stylosanthes scabra]